MTETPKRRWYQFSLRAMLVAFTLLALMLGLVMAFTSNGRRQKAVVERVRGLGGKIDYIGYGEINPPPGTPVPDQSYYSRHVRKWLGRDHVDPVVGVRLMGEGIADDDLAQIVSFTELEVLDLYATSVSDAGLVHIKKLSHLKYLQLSYTEVTDQGVAEIRKALPNCRIEKTP